MKLPQSTLHRWLQASCGTLLLFTLGLGTIGCGSSSLSDTPTMTPVDTDNGDTGESLSFNSINQILQDHCGGAACHSAGSIPKAYVNNEVNLRSSKDSVILRVITLRDMPPNNASAAQRAISDAQRNMIRDFLNQ